MAKRNRRTDQIVIDNRVKAGRGQGHGASYKPWLLTQDVPSLGLATRAKGWKTGRVHHFLSELELQYFYLLEYSRIVVDIREQYPLDREETLTIAERLGIRHPMDPRSKQPIVLTTDFLISVHKAAGMEEQARTIKYAKDLLSERTIEKLEIERQYWTTRKIDWGIVTEREVDKVAAANLEWLHPYRDVTYLSPLSGDAIRRIEAVLTPRVLQENLPLRDITNACDDRLGLLPGSSLSVVRHLLAQRKWTVDMSKPLQPTERLVLTALSAATAGEGRRGAQ